MDLMSNNCQISTINLDLMKEITELAKDHEMPSNATMTPTNQSTPLRWMGIRDNEIIKNLIGINGNSSFLKSTASPTQKPLEADSHLSASERNSHFTSNIGEQVASSQATNNDIRPVTPMSSNYVYGLLSPIDTETPTYPVDSDTSEDDQTPLIRRLTDKDGSSEDHTTSHGPASEDEDELDNLPLSLTRRSKRLSGKVNLRRPEVVETEKWNYAKWKSPSGEMQATAGALIPRGYNFHNDPRYPWICPVRSCRTLFAKLCGLGAHFCKMHRGSLLNDNEDGTMSLVGKKGGAELSMSPEVVSKKPLDLNEPPMAEPSLPYAKLMKMLSTQRGINHSENKPNKGIRFRVSSPYNVCAPTPPKGETGDTLWRYIQSHLVRTPLSPIPKYCHIPELLGCLHRIRDVEFDSRAKNRFNETQIQDIPAMIIQVTGRKANKSCNRCKEGRGPFKGCYIIPTSAPLHLRRSILSCANCYYKGTQSLCDLAQWSLKTYSELSSVKSSRDTFERETAQPNPLQPAETKRLPERRSMRNILRNERRKKKELIRSNSNQGPSHLPARKIQPKDKMERSNVHSNGSTSAVNPAQLIELETWEVAPGRIRDEARETVDNFAFSTAYLTQNQSVRICREISFQVITVKPGTVHSWDTCTTYLRLCSVASGKLQVKIHDQEFSMGPNGMVLIRPDAECTVMNKLYVDAIVHITIVPSDLYE